MNEEQLLEEIERLKKLTTRRTVKQAFKDAYNRWYGIMTSPDDWWSSFGEFVVFFATIIVASILVVLYAVIVILTKGLLALPLLAYPLWVLFRKEE